MIRKRRTQRANLAYIQQPPIRQGFGPNANQSAYQQNPHWQGSNVQYPPQTYAYPPYDPSTGFAPVSLLKSFNLMGMDTDFAGSRSRKKARLPHIIRPRMDRRLGMGKRLSDSITMLSLFDPCLVYGVACCTLQSCLYCNSSHNGILFGTHGVFRGVRRPCLREYSPQWTLRPRVIILRPYPNLGFILECGNCCTWQRLLVGHVATVIPLLHLTDDHFCSYHPPTFFPRRCADRLSLS